MNTYIRINGRGNAWPVFIGQKSNFYNPSQFYDLNNASFSLINGEYGEGKWQKINWSLVIDAGHGVPQLIINQENRIPEAVFITHPHFDHTLGLDWIVQSYCRTHNFAKYPVYASQRSIEFIKQVYPHLESLIEFKELSYGEKQTVEEIPDLEVEALPVFHGKSAFGAVMLVFSVNNKRVAFTGDIAVPILRQSDFEKIKNIDYLFTDSNTRFRHPLSNHWSIVPQMCNIDKEYQQKSMARLDLWLNDKVYLLEPHVSMEMNQVNHQFLNDFINEEQELPASVMEMAQMIEPKNIALVHYSGKEDVDFCGEKQLNTKELETWVNEIAGEYKLNSTKFHVPEVLDLFHL